MTDVEKLLYEKFQNNKKQEGFVSYVPSDLTNEDNDVFEVLRDLLSNDRFFDKGLIEENLKLRILQDNRHYFDYLKSHVENKNEK